jgi:hypothetical protein
MADAESGMGSQREGRQQRTRQSQQAGATGEGRKRGKTGKNTSEDR